MNPQNKSGDRANTSPQGQAPLSDDQERQGMSKASPAPTTPEVAQAMDNQRKSQETKPANRKEDAKGQSVQDEADLEQQHKETLTERD